MLAALGYYSALGSNLGPKASKPGTERALWEPVAVVSATGSGPGDWGLPGGSSDSTNGFGDSGIGAERHASIGGSIPSSLSQEPSMIALFQSTKFLKRKRLPLRNRSFKKYFVTHLRISVPVAPKKEVRSHLTSV